MALTDIEVHGRLHVIVNNEDTRLVRTYDYDNIATNMLVNMIAQCVSGGGSVGISKFQMGTGTGTVAKTDPTLFTPVSGSIITIAARSVSGNQITLTINYPKNYLTGTFTECGLLDMNNSLLTHAILSPSIQIVANESVTILYTLTIN